MDDFIFRIIGLISAPVFGLIGWQVKMLHNKIDKNATRHELLETRFDSHRIFSAETFITKTDIRHIIDGLSNQLNRIEEKLDRKVDK